MKTKLLTSIGIISFLFLFSGEKLYAQQPLDVSTPERFIAYSLYNFSILISWPNSGTLTTFQIAIVGDKTVYGELIELTRNKKIGNALYKITYFKNVEEINGYYQIVYLSNLISGKVKDLNQNPKMKNVLLVTEREGMTRFGSTICFLVNADGRMGFEIAKENAIRNQLTIRLQLERMATRII